MSVHRRFLVEVDLEAPDEDSLAFMSRFVVGRHKNCCETVKGGVVRTKIHDDQGRSWGENVAIDPDVTMQEAS